MINRNDLLCVYLNARSLINKLEYFESWISALNPDIIGVTESWANSNILDSELMLPGYDMFRKDRPVNREGGGVLLYAKSNLQATEFVPVTKFPEQIWCQIQDSNHQKFFVGVCYRTPNDSIYDLDTHSLMRDLIDEMGTTRRHFLLMGDFNYTYSRWPPALDSDRLSSDAKKFCECLDDNFLVQHVSSPTRKDSILDLIISDEPDMISNLLNLGPLATSDHNTLQ